MGTQNFFEVRFPDSYETYGRSGGPGTVSHVQRTFETPSQDIIKRKTPLRVFDISAESIYLSEYEEILSFFLLMSEGKRFRYKDYGDYSATREFVGPGDSNTFEFQLKKNYNARTAAYSIAVADTGNDKVTILEGDPLDFETGRFVEIKGSTGNDGFYEIQGATSETYTITGVDTGTNTVTVSGNHETEFKVNQEIVIDGSTGNDGAYRIRSVANNGANTDIVLKSSISDATADGTVLGNPTLTLSPGIGDATADGTVNLFHTRKIQKPVEGAGVTIEIGGSDLTENTDYFVDYTTGIVTLTDSAISTHLSSTKPIFAKNFEFDVPCRFVTPKLKPTLEAYNYFTFDLTIEEVLI